MKTVFLVLLSFFCLLAGVEAQVTFDKLTSHQSWHWWFSGYDRYENAILSVSGPSIQIDSNDAWFGPGAVAHLWGDVEGNETNNGSNDYTIYGNTSYGVSDQYVNLDQGSTHVHIQQTFNSGGWQNASSADYNLYYDDTQPTFSLTATPTTSSTSWSSSGTFQITIVNPSESNSGVGNVSYHFDSDAWNTFPISGSGSGSTNSSYNNGVISVSGLSNGVHTIYVTVANRVGFASAPQTLTLYVDNSPPTISLTPISLSNWYGPNSPGSNTWNVIITPPSSGLASAHYVVGYSATLPSTQITSTNFSSLSQVASGSIGTTGGFSPTIMGDGFYYAMVTATSNTGVPAVPAISGPYMYDASPPALVAPTAAFAAGGNINLNWNAATQNANGFVYPSPYVATYTVFYSTDGVNFTPTTQTASQQSGVYSLAFPVANYYGQTLTFKVTATDSVGNLSSQTVQITVPPVLTMTAQNNPQGNTTQVMEVDVQFGSPSSVIITPQVMKNSFSQVTITRANQQTGSSVALPDLTISTSTIPLDAQGNLITNPLWKIGSDGQSVCYVDLVPVSSGAGHKRWLYSMPATPWFDSAPSSNVVTLPNNEGSVNLTILDSNGVAYGSSGFGVNANRNFTVQFQGQDPDQDHWHYEIDKITQIQGQNGAVVTSAQKLSGASLIDYLYSNGYPAQNIPITLNIGDNNICATWNEGDITNPALTFSYNYVDVNLKSNSTGGYTITVTGLNGGNVQTSSTSITTRPGDQLSLNLAPSSGNTSTTLTYSWDFGDGGTAGNVASVSHQYFQVVGQTSDTESHTLTISINDGTTTTQIPIDVEVVDTKQGILLTNETWTGDHTVTGVVEVPSGLSLTIAPVSSSSENVFFSGGLYDGFGQGLLIDSGGNLVINDNVSFNQASGQTGGWGTIEVLGSASFGKDDIANADRGIAVGPTVTSFSLSNTSLHGNNIGLHVVGTTVPVLTGAIITNNLVYGIKEDAGGRPILTNSTISNNFRNYYAFDQGLLNITQINGLDAQNANNVGDSTTGTEQ